MSTILKAAPREIQFVLLELDTFVSIGLRGIFFEEEGAQQVNLCSVYSNRVVSCAYTVSSAKSLR